MASDVANYVRAILGEGLMMGWGDEAEAKLRATLGDETYEKALAEIRGEYGTFAKEQPIGSATAEFAGGAIPAIASMIYSGGASAPVAGTRLAGPLARVGRAIGLGKTPLQRSYGQNLGRLAVTGGTQGAISGAGTATEGSRGQGAVVGGITGTALSPVFPLAGTLLSTGYNRLADLVGPSTDRARRWALDKLNLALTDTTSGDIANRIRTDIQMGVPTSMAMVTPATVDLAEAVVQRGGAGAQDLAEQTAKVTAGARERTRRQVRRGLQPRDYYAEEERMLSDLRSNANQVYDKAYAVGNIDDPVINRILAEPEFKRFFDQAGEIVRKRRLAAEIDPKGDPSRWTMKQVYDPQTGAKIDVPDVRTLDYIKQGIDAEIDTLYKAGKSQEAGALRELRTQYVNRLDDLIPEYKTARAQYRGDIETLDALRLGRDKFQTLDSEQIAKMVGEMSDAEKQAFRTGVARNLFGMIMDPSQDFNAAKRIINSPEMVESLRPVFDNPGQFNFFRTALEREMELYKNAQRVLQGSATARRTATRERLEGDRSTDQMAERLLNQGWFGSMLYGISKMFNRAVPEEYWNELAGMLAKGKPGEVAALVRALQERAAAKELPAAAVGATEAGLLGGTLGAISPAPLPAGVELPAVIPAPEGEAYPEIPERDLFPTEEEPEEEPVP